MVNNILEKQLIEIQSKLDNKFNVLKKELLAKDISIDTILENTEESFIKNLEIEEDSNRKKDKTSPTIYRRMIFITLLEIKILELEKLIK
ncbi:hypothetical protein [Vagococcus fluvialis]|uniref:hypothetical protein n=1 Tax=Vagococcus fluvialis TaxID=2738 RepID=UPI0028F749D6|nr:hypothetical protein [Vagococcus fluvialis]WNF91630.1 hypothetical protein QDW48_13920 [Vagococcus fluvialis]